MADTDLSGDFESSENLDTEGPLTSGPGALDSFDDGDLDQETAQIDDLRSEQVPVDLLLYPTKKERISKLPLFQLIDGSDPSDPSTPKKSFSGFYVQPLGAQPIQWLRDLDKNEKWEDIYTVRLGLILYLAGAGHPWAKLVREAMRAHKKTLGSKRTNGENPCTEGEIAFFRRLARLDPWPILLEDSEESEAEERSESEALDKLPSASLLHIATELEKMAQTGELRALFSQALNTQSPQASSLPSNQDIRRFAAILASRIRGTLSKITKEGDSETLGTARLNFRFLLPDGSLTELSTWFGWISRAWSQRLHPLVANRVLRLALFQAKVKKDEYSKKKIKDHFTELMLPYMVLDRKKVENLLTKNKGLETKGFELTS